MSDVHDEISTYLLGELDSEAAAEFERRLSADPALREEVERLRPVVASLHELPGDVWEAPEPPPLEMPPAARERRRLPRLRLPALTLRPAAALALSALFLAVGVGLGAVLAGGGGDGAGEGTTLELARIDDGPAGAHGSVRVSDDGARALVDVRGLEPSGSDRFYELWLLDESGRMVALGSFPVGEDGSADVEVPIPVQPSRYRYFDLSLQEDNGSPEHSGISVLRGPTQL